MSICTCNFCCRVTFCKSWEYIAGVKGFSIKNAYFFLYFKVPETPQWLLSKNRTNEAGKSLQWLRGWVSSDEVSAEFAELKRHSERSKSCSACLKQELRCPHPLPTWREKLSDLKKRRNLRPFAILGPLFFLIYYTGDIN